MISFKRLIRVATITISTTFLGLGSLTPGLIGQASADSTSGTVPLTGTITMKPGVYIGGTVIVQAVATDGSGRTYSLDTVSPGVRTMGMGENAMGIPYIAPLQPGHYELDVEPGTYDVEIREALSGNAVDQQVVVDGPTTFNAQLGMGDVTYHLSGTFTDAAGDPISNGWIEADDELGADYFVKTDSNGYYDMEINGYGLVQAIIGYDFDNTNPDLPQNFVRVISTDFAMLEDRVVNIQTPETVPIHVHVTDTNGNPAVGALVGSENESININDQSLPQMDEASIVPTDANGIATFMAWKDYDLSTPPCAYFISENLRSCSEDQISPSTDTTMEISKVGALFIHLTTPGDFAIDTTGAEPVLSWTGYAGEEYEIYRDGREWVGVHITDNTFTDTTATPGPHSYYIKAYAYRMFSPPTPTITIGQ